MFPEPLLGARFSAGHWGQSILRELAPEEADSLLENSVNSDLVRAAEGTLGTCLYPVSGFSVND